MKENFEIVFLIYMVITISVIAWLGFFTFSTRKETRAFNVKVITAIQTMDSALGTIYKNNPSLFLIDKKEEGNNKK